MSGQLCRTCSDWPCICGADASHALLPKPQPIVWERTPRIGNCERCGSDRFVRTAKVNGQRVCLNCEDAMKLQPMEAYKQMVERTED